MGVRRLFAQPDPEVWLPPCLDVPPAGAVHFIQTWAPGGTPMAAPCNCHLQFDHDELGEPAR